MASISYPEAAKALAEALAAGDSMAEGQFYVTAAEPYESEGATIYMVGYAAPDPEESDDEGDPTGFTRGEDGKVTCVGAIF